MIKILSVFGTRPEFIKLSRIIPLLDKYFDHKIIHTGQNNDFELNQIFFDDLNIRTPDFFLNCNSDSPSKTIGEVIIKTDKIIKNIRPDIFFLLGDTNSCYASIAAKKNKIPIFHYEAGNRCFDQNVPEEINRKIIDHLSNINITYSDSAKQNLIFEGFPADRVICIGSPMYEVLNFYKKKISRSKALKRFNVKKNNFFLVSLHREENVDDRELLKRYFDIFDQLQKKYDKCFLISTHFRTAKRIKDGNIIIKNKNIRLLKPISFTDYVFLQKNSFTTLSDSGTLAEESSILKFPAIHLRHCTERPEAMQNASMIISGPDFNKIVTSISLLKSRNIKNQGIYQGYTKNNISEIIISTILSYFNYLKNVKY